MYTRYARVSVGGMINVLLLRAGYKPENIFYCMHKRQWAALTFNSKMTNSKNDLCSINKNVVVPPHIRRLFTAFELAYTLNLMCITVYARYKIPTQSK